MDHLFSIEDGEKSIDCLSGVARAWSDVFSKDAPSILYSPQEGVVIWLGHGTLTTEC